MNRKLDPKDTVKDAPVEEEVVDEKEGKIDEVDDGGESAMYTESPIN
jgi:hypothetical protein